MIQLQKLEPIHFLSTPKGKVFKTPPSSRFNKFHFDIQNPQLSLLILPTHTYFENKFIKKQPPEISLINCKRPFKRVEKFEKFEKRDLTQFNKTDYFKKMRKDEKRQSPKVLIRKKIRSVCLTHRESSKRQLKECLQNLYLKINCSKVMMESSNTSSNNKKQGISKYFQNKITKN